jgi:diaminopimelate decarboxylase
MPYPEIRTDFTQVPSPCYVMEERRLRANLEILQQVSRDSGA